MTPRQSRTVHSEILNDEVCVYEWTTKEVHVLNSTAARIWRLCDGRTSVREIARPLAAELGIRDAEAVVWLALRDFREKGLIESGLAMPDDRALSRRQLIARLGVAAAALPVIHSIVAPTPLQAASAGTQTFNFTGASQTFVVPAGVGSITIDASGADGGTFREVLVAGGGSKGGRVQATFAVTSGELLVVSAGGSGWWGDPLGGTVHIGGAGGFNGGGRGGVFGCGGGGASDVRRGTTKLVVAGGAGGDAPSTGGGAGGGLVGAAGTTLSTNPNSGQPGGGGTQSAGGAGGLGQLLGTPKNGSAGTPGVGGNGGGGDIASFGGGGGGGGFFGGGGGGGGDLAGPIGGSLPAGGGGGGSSYTDPSATNVIHTQGVRAGHGQIIISW